MSRIYYPLRFRLDYRDRYLLWHTDDEAKGDSGDGVALDARGAIPTFRTLAALAAYAQAHDLSPVSDETPILYPLDTVRPWLKRKRHRTSPLDCDALLAAWNLFADVSRSIGGNFDADKTRTRRVYEKLLWGTNPPSLTPPGKCCIPVWSSAEQRLIRGVLTSGLRLFRSHMTFTTSARSSVPREER